MVDRERSIAGDDWLEVPVPLYGSASGVSEREPDAAPTIWVPDGHGDYREHQVVKRPPRRLGF